MTDKITRPPKDNLVRAVFPAPIEYRDESNADDGTIGTLEGHFAVWDQWTEINSSWEGHFLERIKPSAFDKTLSEHTPKVLFQHGQDPVVGDKPLGKIREVRSDAQGMYYNVGLLDTSYNRDIQPGLKAGLYGSSFRFAVVKEDFKRDAKRSDHNPEGLPERTILEATLPEFGPVTFPAYMAADATARMAMRSMTAPFWIAALNSPQGPKHSRQTEPTPVTPTRGAAARQSLNPNHRPLRRQPQSRHLPRLQVSGRHQS
jgi:HK97 family phage prohead protease